MERGYTVVIVNHLVPKYEAATGLRLLDFGDSDTMHEIYDFVRQKFSTCDYIFGVGFSLGGCYILKSAGALNSKNETVNFTALATIG